MKTLLVVDGNSILNRAFYGVRPLTNSKGLHTNAVYGFVTMLSHQIDNVSPDYCAIAFDMKAPTFRHKMYDGYKATRKGMPEELAEQVDYAHRIAAALGFSVFQAEGYEADDILGTFAAHGDSSDEVHTVIMTGDRDSLQLISDRTSVLLATNNDYVMYDRAAFYEKYGIDPSQFVDVKAIMGDSSDNIPGVSGIGEKGAFALISQFGSLDSVFENYRSSGTLKPGMIAKLDAGKESAMLSRTLAQIFRQVPGIPDISELPDFKPDCVALKDLFTELEFNGLIKKFGLDKTVAEETSADVSDYAPQIPYEKKNDFLSFEKCIKTPGAAISFGENSVVSVYAQNVVSTVDCSVEILKLIAEAAADLVCCDCKTAYKISDSLGVRLRGIGFDVMLAAYVLDAQGPTDLDRLITANLGEVRNENVPEVVYIYRIAEVLREKLKERSCSDLFVKIEMPLADVLADMEEEGFLIDREGLAEYGGRLNEAVSEISGRIYFLAGEEFNINSPKQLGEILFEKMGLPSGKKTKTGYSTNADVLEKLAPDYPIVEDILEYRKLTKLIGTYVTGLIKVAGEDGRVHTNFKQTGTATGRLSSAEPNLQNIPIKTDEGRELRKYFLPRKDCVLIDADYSQIELRLLACISGDKRLSKAFIDGEDIHSSTASAVFGVPLAEVTPLLRKRAKAVNFGIVYGIGDYSLSQDLGISVKQAKEYITSYLANYPGVSSYLTDIVQSARENGYVDTIYGRRRFIPEISGKNAVMRKFGERVAMNSPIQGSAADIIKIAMINVSRRLKDERLDARMILQVHDELIVESAKECADRAAAILREEMENAVSLPVPLTVDLSVGDRWFET